MPTIRYPCAIGFYPPEKNSVRQSIKDAFSDPHGAGAIPELNPKRQKTVVAGIAPHAGFVYSGPIASHLYKAIAEDGFPSTFILIGPKHGFIRFQGAVIMAEGIWETPLGKCSIDNTLARQILDNSEQSGMKCVIESKEAHRDEHSLEVQLPFLQFFSEGQSFQMVPLLISSPNFVVCEKVGKVIAEAIQKTKRDVIVIASTDFTHYGQYFYNYAPVGSGPVDKVVNWVHETDKDLIQKIEHFDGKALLGTVVKEERTMCGASAVATTLVVAQQIGATKSKLLKYATSYDVRGSSEAIVGYASILLQR